MYCSVEHPSSYEVAITVSVLPVQCWPAFTEVEGGELSPSGFSIGGPTPLIYTYISSLTTVM